MNWLKRNGYLKEEILDYGCGHGSDVKFLTELKLNATGYDNYYFDEYPTKKYETITCIYVLNVLEPVEQSKVLMSISQLLKPKGKAYFVVRRDIKNEGFRNHYIHKKPTFQTNVVLPFKSIYKNDFTEIYEYQHYEQIVDKKLGCIFCSPKRETLIETALAYSVFDKFPVSKGHTLIIPKSHVSNYFELTLNEQISCNLIINEVKKYLDKKFKPSGYNIGINIGETAGQTINHVHIHLIPRYKNDLPNPIGGVRNIFPLKGDYTKNPDEKDEGN
jgi:diadenosine tetraphosphate (Ap4A) HIT family hydrolase